jgi:hypothetical protein
MTEEIVFYGDAPDLRLGVLETVITGGHHSAALRKGEVMVLVREKGNKQDPKAVRVLNQREEAVGYLPLRIVSWLAPMLDRDAVEVTGRVVDTRSLRHGLTPLDLKVELTKHGYGALGGRPLPTNAGEALHHIVSRTFFQARDWERPELIREAGEWLAQANCPTRLPETRMLLALFPALAHAVEEGIQKSQVMANLMKSIQNVTLGEPLHYRNLTLFPLFLPNDCPPDYTFLSEAIENGTAEVTELSEDGSVPELRVVNHGAKPLLVVEGEVVTGAKQNRVVNITVFVAAHSESVLPVSCVEQGRWSQSHREFRATHYAPPSVRACKSRSVHENRRQTGEAQSDQGAVWEEVQFCLKSVDFESDTDSLTDGHAASEDRVQDYFAHLALPENSMGVLVGMGDKVQGLDLFGSSQTFQAIWDRLGAAYFLEAAHAEEDDRKTYTRRARQFLRDYRRELQLLPKRDSENVEFITESEDLVGAALCNNNQFVHGYAFPVR